MPLNRQPEQQQRGTITGTCPGCKQPARLVGRENEAGQVGDLLTFQCNCGQVFTTMTNQ
jgi:hypothetical protein